MSAKTDLNRATSRNLCLHLNIPLELANDIVNFRRQSGGLKNMDDLWQLKGMSKRYFGILCKHSVVGSTGDSISMGKVLSVKKRDRFSKHIDSATITKLREFNRQKRAVRPEDDGTLIKTVRFDNVNQTANLDTVIILDKDGEKYSTVAQSVVIQSSPSGNKLVINCHSLQNDKRTNRSVPDGEKNIIAQSNSKERKKLNLADTKIKRLPSTKQNFWKRISNKFGKYSHSANLQTNKSPLEVAIDTGKCVDLDAHDGKTHKASQSGNSGRSNRLSADKIQSINEWLDTSTSMNEVSFSSLSKLKQRLNCEPHVITISDVAKNGKEIQKVGKHNKKQLHHRRKRKADLEKKLNGSDATHVTDNCQLNDLEVTRTADTQGNRRDQILGKSEKSDRGDDTHFKNNIDRQIENTGERNHEKYEHHNLEIKTKISRGDSIITSPTQESGTQKKHERPRSPQPGPSAVLYNRNDTDIRHRKKIRHKFKKRDVKDGPDISHKKRSKKGKKSRGDGHSANGFVKRKTVDMSTDGNSTCKIM